MKIEVHEVAAVIVTRGDVRLDPILDSLIFPEVIVWDNSGTLTIDHPAAGRSVRPLPGDLGAYGRYTAAAQAAAPIVYFQDDDCIVAPDDQRRLVDSYEPGVLSALMPPERVDYHDTVLVGWGSLCDRDLPGRAFARWAAAGKETESHEFRVVGADFVFPMLVAWKRLDAYHRDLPHAHAPNRTWGYWPRYGFVKEQYLTEARRIRDGA